MIRPHLPAPADRYCRLFPAAKEETQRKMTAAALGSLAASMLRVPDQTPIPLALQLAHPPPVIAATYFGQFLDHDLTFDITPLSEAGRCEPNYIINYRTPWLDLDHLYGEGPDSERHGHLYEANRASFRLGYSAFGGEPFDVPLTSDGQPDIVDERNGENVMIRQIHAMFLKLHNAAVEELPVTLPPRERFDRARERVRWQYQWLVRHWYLREICDRAVYRSIIEKGERLIDWQSDGFSIPIEFTAAAMRFGHSMVRREYELNLLPVGEFGSGTVPLSELLGRRNPGPLPRRLKIDWALLFKRARGQSMSIDTAIVRPLFGLPNEQFDPYAKIPILHSLPALAERSLARAAALKIPTGDAVRQALGIIEPISPTPPEYEEDPWRHLQAAGLADDAPLFYYVLLEAELEQIGERLGRVGSRLVAEVIEGSLLCDAHSFLRRQPAGWKPPAWKTPDGRSIEVTTLQDVAIVAGV